MRIILWILQKAIEKFDIKDKKAFIKKVFMILSIIGTLLEIAAIVIFGCFTHVLGWVIFSLVCNITLRLGEDVGDHYDTWKECFLSSILISVLYTFSIILFFYHPVPRFILAILMAIFFRKRVLSTL